MKNQCKTCKCYLPFLKDNKPLTMGECHRYPPQVYESGLKIGEYGNPLWGNWSFPRVTENNYCWEWGKKG